MTNPTNESDARQDGQTFNAAILMEQVMDDVDLFHEILAVFLQELPNHLSQIRQGLSTEETELAYRGAHSLKGAAMNVGALEVAGLASELERVLKDQTVPPETETLVTRTQQAVDRLCLHLESLKS